MADSSREGKVSKQDLDDSLCEEDFSQTLMPKELLKFHNISNNSNNDDKKYGSNSFSEDEDLQIRAPSDAGRFSNNSTSVHLHDNDSIQRSPSILIDPQPSTQVINIQKKKPIFGNKNKSHSSHKYRVANNAPAATDNNDGSDLSPANGREKSSDKPSKESRNGREKLGKKFATKDASKTTLTKSSKEPTSGEEKPTPKSASKKLAVTKSAEEKKNVAVDKPKKKVSIKAEKKALKCEPKKLEKKNKNTDNEQKMIEKERKREENKRLKEEKKLKSQPLKDHCDQKKAELEHKKREKMFARGQTDSDELKTTFTAQRAKEGQTKVNAQKKESVKQPDVNDVLEVNPIPEEKDSSSMHDLEFQDPAEVAASISSPESPLFGMSSILSKDIGSPTHNAYLDFKNSITCNDTVFPVVYNLKQPLPEDALSAAPLPKRAKLDSSVAANFTDQTKSLRTGFEMKNRLVSPDPKERNKTTKFDAGTRPFQKKPQTKMHMKANMTGPVWVKCCNTWCQKWRQLKDHFDPLTVPTFWKCTENSDTNCNDCSIPMEQWNDYENDEFQFVESAYVPGSLVWAKLGSYPWWPAMVEADPDKECYYEMGPTNLLVPVKYHVVFFDTPVSRSWLQANSLVPFADVADANKEHKYRVSRKYAKNLCEGMKQAKEALKIDVKERLDVYGFRKRHGAHSKKVATLRKRPKAIPYISITKKKFKGEETEAMKEEVMRVAEKTKEDEMIRMEKEIGEEEVRMEWEKGENDKQDLGTAQLQPED